MNPFLILSDHHVIRSDEPPEPHLDSSSQTPQQACSKPAANRRTAARFADRDLQTLWASELPLCRWAGSRTEAVSVRQPTGNPGPDRLRAECGVPSGRTIRRQFPAVAPIARRDLRDQHRTPETARGSGIDRHGPRTHCFRLRRGGRHHRKHDRVLSCCWRPAVRSGGA
jgi:hypothetical protein